MQQPQVVRQRAKPTIKTIKKPAPSVKLAAEQRERRHREQAITSWLRSLVRKS